MEAENKACKALQNCSTLFSPFLHVLRSEQVNIWIISSTCCRWLEMTALTHRRRHSAVLVTFRKGKNRLQLLHTLRAQLPQWKWGTGGWLSCPQVLSCLGLLKCCPVGDAALCQRQTASMRSYIFTVFFSHAVVECHTCVDYTNRELPR